MSLNNPAVQEASSRPGTSSRQREWGGDEATDAAQPQPIASPTYDRPADEVANTTTETHDGGTDQTSTHTFQPFFTLIEDAHTSDYHHPTVHYIFSDDDTDIVTEAALRSLEAQQDASPGSKKDHAFQSSDQANMDSENGKPSLLPPPIPGVRENYIVLDVEPAPSATQANPNPTPADPSTAGAGVTTATSPPPSNQPQTQTQQPSPGAGVPPSQYRVTGAKSFSPAWQVLGSELMAAPTFENQDSGETPGHGLMLKIHGTGGLATDTGREKGERDRGPQRVEDMMDQFAKRMRELQMVIDAAEVEAEGEAAPGGGTDDRDSGKGEEQGILGG